jgi:NADPH:quinone reductase-like Zn-dependent oxidoreductase
MQACYIERYGGPDVVKNRRAASADSRPRRTRVSAWKRPASIRWISRSATDCCVRLQSYRMPAILGNDAAGVVTALGPGVTGFALGDHVAARLDKARMGAFAEFVLARQRAPGEDSRERGFRARRRRWHWPG